MTKPSVIHLLGVVGLLTGVALSCSTQEANKSEPASNSVPKLAAKTVATAPPSAPVLAPVAAPASTRLPQLPAKPAPAAEVQAAKSPDAVEKLSPTITVTLKTRPRVAARVRMGSKRLGTIVPGKPLVIERPRDSGPLDLVIRATGFIPVHTRAYTFEDSLFTVKLTKKEEQETLYGYRKPLPPSDAGVEPVEP